MLPVIIYPVEEVRDDVRWSHPPSLSFSLSRSLSLTAYFFLLSAHTIMLHMSSHTCILTLLHNAHIFV